MISVVIPALNEEDYIGNCLKSLIEQEYSKKYEIIVMDNGSEDRTREIAKKYCDRLFVEPDLELYELRNEGIRRAQGKIVAQTDADCIAPKNWLKEVERGLENSVLATGPVGPIEDSNLYGVLLNLFNNFLRVSMNLFNFSHASAGNCAFYRDLAISIGGFKDSFPSDGKFGVEMRGLGKLYFNPDMKVKTSMRRYKNESFSKTLYELAISHIKLRWGEEQEFEKSFYWS
ncbi:hypothetical protein AKJ56_01935 [candidate division MSBL1 archaeon SCGC-AAA382N08]|uniref:Glycosyltransferase 2-like domain-containing protein n=1 Tax=candidate division MSBL1 archaeon SCGC-AAA382N08 TaxID=1698285 RepID=A0A133VNM0_9EURY|nr:hypothetical protein AKJ56_01935 [candidate division MSBL1 archaeon SCGC-AAA382N08]